ncbi:hypothetical protein GMRT_12739 [Giardia muris]|uniref:Misato Segment II tubulin-like domain-containing protein n=1 Tax=Giardia muris TaxID=5742 RepID=A0A4Z1SUD0_GIAMU|nr:hypothetical protein GMRT_12739 [Giardia muris]|eukprot:TNJ28575.1 hypothetical protein GMRT_12739 [Giardia muris]
MSAIVTLAVGRVPNFLAQHYWNNEVANATRDPEATTITHQLFSNVNKELVPRSVSVDYVENRGPLPMEESNLTGLVRSQSADVIRNTEPLSDYHLFRNGLREPEARKRYAQAGAKAYAAWEQAGYKGIDEISDVRIEYQRLGRYGNDYMEPNTRGMECWTPFWRGQTTQLREQTEEQLRRQLEAIDRLDALQLFVSGEEGWNGFLSCLLDDVVAEIAKRPLLTHQPIDTLELFQATSTPSSGAFVDNAELLYDLSQLGSDFITLPYNSTITSIKEENGSNPYISMALPALAASSFSLNARRNAYSIAGVVQGLLPIPDMSIVISRLATALPNDTEKLLDLTGMTPEQHKPLALVRSFYVNQKTFDLKSLENPLSYPTGVARSLVLQGSLIHLGETFPHIFPERYGLRYRVMTPATAEYRNSPDALSYLERLETALSLNRSQTDRTEEIHNYVATIAETYRGGARHHSRDSSDSE